MAKRSVIVFAPQGCGMTRLREALRQHFGLDHVLQADDLLFQPYRRRSHIAIPAGTLVLANEWEVTEIRSRLVADEQPITLSLDDAMRQLGDTK